MIFANRLSLVLGFFLFVFSISAHALPSFARQTNQECTTCHIGGFGMQLTPYGIKFKIGGYTETNVKDAPLIPLSGSALAGFTNTRQDNAAPPGGFNANNNVALIQASLFVAGKLYDNIGSFVQGTYDGVDNYFHLDTVDIRYARETSLFDEDMTLGLSLNNNPTHQDPFNTLAAWRFPFATTSGSLAAPSGGGLGTSPMLDNQFDGRVFGLSAYTFLDKGLYFEYGSYMPSSTSYMRTTGIINDTSNLGLGLTGYAPYWRLAYMKDYKKWMYSAGFFGMKGNVRQINTQGKADQFMDWGFDANYQYLGTRKHIFALAASYTHENISCGQTYIPTQLGLAQNSSAFLQEVQVTASYNFLQTYGATVNFFDILGSADNLYYANQGYSNNRPNSNGMVYQLDWTPFGKENSWGAPWVNLRLGAQFTAYFKYNGDTSSAYNNNTAFIFAWTAF